MKPTLKLNLARFGRSRTFTAALEEIDGGDATVTPPADGVDPNAAPADAAPADPTSTDTPTDDGAPAGDDATPPADGDLPVDENPVTADDPAGDVPPADGADPAPLTPEDTPPADANAGAGGDGNAEVDALPEAPVIDPNAPADGAIAADGAPDPEVDAVTASTDENVIGEEIADQSTELNEIEVGVDQTTDDVGTLETAMEELRDMLAIGEASIERGGLDTFAARNMSGRMRLVCKPINVKPPSFAALESVDGDPSDQIFETQQANSATKDVLSRVKDTFTKATAELADWAKRTYAVITDASMRVEKRAMALKAAAATGGQAVQVTDTSVIAGVTLGDAVPGDIARAILEHTKAMQALNAPGTYAKLLEAVDTAQAMANDPSKKSSLDARIAQAISGYSNKIIGTTTGVIKGGSNGSSTSSLFGGKQLVITIPSEAGRIGEAKSVASDSKPANVPSSVNGVDPQTAVKICDTVINAARQLREFNKSGATHRVNERMISLLKTAASSEGQDEGVSASINKLVQDIAKAGAQIPAYSFNRAMIPALNAALDFVAASAGAAAAAPAAPGAAPTAPAV